MPISMYLPTYTWVSKAEPVSSQRRPTENGRKQASDSRKSGLNFDA